MCMYVCVLVSREKVHSPVNDVSTGAFSYAKSDLSYVDRQAQQTAASHSTSTSSYHVPSGHPTANGTIPSRKHLVDVRVIQRNLVYVTGIPLAIAREDILRRQEYFGRYGKIVKVAINRSNSYNNSYNSSAYGPSASAYVTFER